MSLGKFNPDVLQRLNAFLKKYQVCPSCGEYDDTYYVGVTDEEGAVVDWCTIDEISSRYAVEFEHFRKEWLILQNEILFVGEIFHLECGVFFLVGEDFKTEISTTDRITRCFRQDSNIDVLKVLSNAAFVLFDPDNDATNHQGSIAFIEEVKGVVPTLRFISY